MNNVFVKKTKCYLLGQSICEENKMLPTPPPKLDIYNFS